MRSEVPPTKGSDSFGRPLLILQNIPDEIVVLIKLRKVIMPAPMNSDQCNFSWIKFL